MSIVDSTVFHSQSLTVSSNGIGNFGMILYDIHIRKDLIDARIDHIHKALA
jgi:hypothetical protein